MSKPPIHILKHTGTAFYKVPELVYHACTGCSLRDRHKYEDDTCFDEQGECGPDNMGYIFIDAEDDGQALAQYVATKLGAA